MKTVSQEDFKKMYGETTLSSIKQPSTEKPGYLERLKQDFSSRAADVQEGKARQSAGTQTGAETFGQTLGQGIGMVTDVVAEAPGVKQVLTGAGAGIKALSETPLIKALGGAASPVASKLLEHYDSASDREKANIEAVLNIGSIAPVGKAGELAMRAGVKAVETAVPVVSKAAGAVTDLSKRATSKIIQATEPVAPAPLEAVGQVLQGKTTDVPKGVKGLSTLDTTGIKTYADLKGKIDSKITELANTVDAELAKDTTRRPLKSLVLTQNTLSGKTVVIKPINDALTQLNELYVKTGDKVSAANIKELAAKAKTDGLTNQEINDIAKVYGSEFKTKAFSKTGDPLTSVNAQMYENTRKYLKTLARQGITGKEAKLADRQMSALYNIQTLTEKNIEAVNKLKQRIQERGLFEKVGHAVTKYGDMLTGGSLRGMVGGLLPRGAGYKTLNALDVEEALGKNLELIQKAIKSGDNTEIIKILKELGS
jgi:hypothetical protein